MNNTPTTKATSALTKHTTTYPSTTQIPRLVQKAIGLAKKTGFKYSCTPEVGRLLQVMASRYQTGVLAELGTGCGVGSAWIVSALAPTTRFVTVELDEERAELARQLFKDFPNVLVIQGDWHTILSYSPFDLIFADGGKAKESEPGLLVQSLAIGGTVVLDDLTPEFLWTEEQKALWKVDPTRHFWLNDPRLAATEILVTPQSAVIVATRRNGEG